MPTLCFSLLAEKWKSQQNVKTTRFLETLLIEDRVAWILAAPSALFPDPRKAKRRLRSRFASFLWTRNRPFAKDRFSASLVDFKLPSHFSLFGGSLHFRGTLKWREKAQKRFRVGQNLPSMNSSLSKVDFGNLKNDKRPESRFLKHTTEIRSCLWNSSCTAYLYKQERFVVAFWSKKRAF